MFQESDNPLIKSIYQSKILSAGNEGFMNTIEGMKQIRTKFHGFQVFYMIVFFYL